MAMAVADQVTTIRLNLSDEVFETYNFLLFSNTVGITFLFGSYFTAALKATAEHFAAQYDVSTEKVIEEFRRLLAIKAFTSDCDATKS